MNVVSETVGLPLSVGAYAAALSTLTAARSVIETGWAQGYYALDNGFNHVEPDHPDACSFCAVGALAKAADVPPFQIEKSYSMDYLNRAFYYVDEYGYEDYIVPDLNDANDTKHRHVLMAYDFAILMAEDDLAEAQAKK